MTNREYENQHWLYAWLKHRVKYQNEEVVGLDQHKSTVKNINFSWYQLKGKLVIENFPKLTTLNLGNNKLVEVEIKNCPQLREIITSHNQELIEKDKEIEFTNDKGETEKLKMKVSEEANPTLTKLTITNCPEVRELYCSDNGLTELDVSALTNLTVLSYDNNNFTPEKKTQLASLGLKSENPTGQPIKVLNNDDFIDNHEVTEIDISNEAGWEGKLEIKNCPNLTSLVVDNCKLNELVIEDCPNLKLLSFRHNKLKKVDLTKLTKLEGLYCSNNQLKSLNTINNLALKHLVCDNNPITKLKVKHLTSLESLYCFKCSIHTQLDCGGLDKLEELYCANNVFEFFGFTNGLKKINLKGCDNLEILDCAENYLSELVITDKPKLKTISCKENWLKELTIKNCPTLECLDLAVQPNNSFTKLTIDNFNNIKEFFYDEGTIIPDLKNMPNLKLIRVGEFRKVEGEEKKKYLFKEIDFVELRNIEKVEQLLAKGEENITLEELEAIMKEELYGVSDELRQQLAALGTKKLRERFADENYDSGEEEENLKAETLFLKGVKREVTFTEFLNKYAQINLNLISNWLQEELTNLIKEWRTETEQEKFQDLLVNQDQMSPDELMHELELLDQDLLDEETKEQVTKLLAKLQQMPEEKQEPEGKDVYEFNEEEQKPFSLSDLVQLEQFFIQHEIKNVFLKSGNKLVIEYHNNNNNNNNKAELQQIFNYLKSSNKTSLSQAELNQIITEQKKEQLPSTNPTNYVPHILGGAMVVLVMIGVFIYWRKKIK